jgi:hypothetical protein
MSDETNSCQLNLTTKEFYLLDVLYALGSAKMLEVLGVEFDESSVVRFISRYRAVIAGDDDLLDVLNSKLVAVRNLVQFEAKTPTAPSLPTVVRHDLSEPEAILHMNLLSLASTFMAEDVGTATVIFMSLKELIEEDPDTYNRMLIRITRTTTAALPNSDFIEA